MIYHTGEEYKGDFIKGVKEGIGIIYFPNGTKFDGEFK